MVRKFWLIVVLVAGLGVAAATLHFMSRTSSAQAPAASLDTAPTAPVAATAPVTTAALPASAEPGDAARPIVAYDRYRAEMQRIRAAREDAQSLRANERCIGSQRFRKVGTAWERAGDC